MSTEAGGFRDPTALTRWLRILLWTSLGLGVLSVGSGLLELKLLHELQDGATLPPGAAGANDLRQQVIGGVRFILLISTIVVFAIWIYRANYNARQLGAAGMQFTPGWSVGWYFIPVANLWKPYQAMKEIWKASAAPAHWQEQPRGAILPWWWFLFIVSNLLSNIAFRLMLSAKTLSEIIAASTMNTVSDTVDIVNTAVALVLVGQIFRMQMANRAAGAEQAAPATGSAPA